METKKPITIKLNCNGQSLTIKVDLEQKIQVIQKFLIKEGNLQGKLQSEDDDISSLSLLSFGKRLNVNSTFQSYDIKNNCTLNLKLTCGGGKGFVFGSEIQAVFNNFKSTIVDLSSNSSVIENKPIATDTLLISDNKNFSIQNSMSQQFWHKPSRGKVAGIALSGTIFFADIAAMGTTAILLGLHIMVWNMALTISTPIFVVVAVASLLTAAYLMYQHLQSSTQEVAFQSM